MADRDGDVTAKPNDRSIGDRARDATRDVLDEANRQGQRGMTTIGQTLENAASYVESKVGGAVQGGKVPVLNPGHVDTVAGGLHSAAKYLQDHDPRSAIGDLDRAIQRHPYRAMAIGIGVGWLIGRLTRRD
jgi:hypothetical protein